MAKTTYIQIRCTDEEKEMLQRRAELLLMNVSEYMIHAGLTYVPSPAVQASLDKMAELQKEQTKAIEQYLK